MFGCSKATSNPILWLPREGIQQSELKGDLYVKDIINKVSQFDESKQNLALDMTDVVKELERRSNENKNTKYSILQGNGNDENLSTIGFFFLMKNENSYWKSCGN